jgi:exopolysaccharide biosynthesis polyprenyl glycosylphosphotransferase
MAAGEMLSKRTEAARIALFVLDQVFLASAFLAAFQLKAHAILPDPQLNPGVYGRLYLVAAPVLALALSCCGFYRLKPDEFPPQQIRSRDMLWGGFVSMAVLILVGFVMTPVSPAGQAAAPYSRAIAFMFMGLSTLGLALSRKLLSAASSRLQGEAHRRAKVVVFGMSPRILKLLGVFERTSHMHVDVVGVSAHDVPEDLANRLDTADAMALIAQGRVDHVLVEAGAVEGPHLNEILALSDQEGISVHITASIFPSTNLVPSWDRIGGVPVLGFVTAELPFGARCAKRIFDVSLSAAALLVLTPVMATIALLIRIDSKGRSIFVQSRVGARGRTFPMFKFRTMRLGAEAGTGPVMAVENDDRCTRLGGFLRRWNLDELPQLANVFLGHMSLVGPRPERPEFVEGFKRTIPRYAHKHWFKPGITGWAQVHGLRGASTSLEDRIDHDMFYIEHWSLAFDVRILVRTLVDGYVNAT